MQGQARAQPHSTVPSAPLSTPNHQSSPPSHSNTSTMPSVARVSSFSFSGVYACSTIAHPSGSISSSMSSTFGTVRVGALRGGGRRADATFPDTAWPSPLSPSPSPPRLGFLPAGGGGGGALRLASLAPSSLSSLKLGFLAADGGGGARRVGGVGSEIERENEFGVSVSAAAAAAAAALTTVRALEIEPWRRGTGTGVLVEVALRAAGVGVAAGVFAAGVCMAASYEVLRGRRCAGLTQNAGAAVTRSFVARRCCSTARSDLHSLDSGRLFSRYLVGTTNGGRR